ncbi:hypothetical protein CC78DRAFT_586169 [Lojkania enalia]|uniref:Uncharacterized protein n=1 Tax=Lojkania enalia TaxID=147567 RepID=A0A9P4MZ87_9PLEO|nr:hypothetical protein CC78DRAFT_586169 [Didymosphaeria enalia]
MATSDSDHNPSTPPPAPAKRTRRRTTKAPDILQQPPTTRATASRSIQAERRAIVLLSPQNEEPNGIQQHPEQHELPLPHTGRVSTSSRQALDGDSTGIGELAELIASLKQTIVQQNNIIANQNKIIEDIQSDRATFRAEQQNLKDQIVELRETICSLQTQLNTRSTEAPSRHTWAAVAASGQQAGLGTRPLRSTNRGRVDKENERQLVIDVSQIRDDMTEKVATTEAAKQAIQQSINGVESLVGTTVKDFRVWRANNNTSVIKFSVDKNKEAAVRQATVDWLEPTLPGARLLWMWRVAK